MYYTGRRAKEGLRELCKNSFEIKIGSDGLKFVEITFNEKTKKNQGSDNSMSKRALHNNHHIISAMPGNELCPVKSFKTYLSLLHHEENAFFQYPNKRLTGFNNAPIGKNSLGTFMKEISKAANLSKVYTNHCIHKTTATSMRKQGFDLNQISHVTKHKNLDSLKHYISAPTYSEKRKYNDAMYEYATGTKENDGPPSPKRATAKNPIITPKPPEAEPKNLQSIPADDNIPEENCLVPIYPDSEDSNTTETSHIIPVTKQQNIVNTLRNAQHLFQNASFNNCNFTFQLPKWHINDILHLKVQNY